MCVFLFYFVYFYVFFPPIKYGLDGIGWLVSLGGLEIVLGLWSPVKQRFQRHVGTSSAAHRRYYVAPLGPVCWTSAEVALAGFLVADFLVADLEPLLPMKSAEHTVS